MGIEATALSFAGGVNYRDSWSGRKPYRETVGQAPIRLVIMNRLSGKQQNDF
jgi:hypothetical protein